jgi:hypothetical protein
MNTKKIWAGVFAGAVLSVLSACLLPAGDGEGLTPDGTWIPAVPPDTNLTFVVNTILKPKCSGCHGANPVGDPIQFNSVSAARASLFNSDSTKRLTAEEPTVHPIYRVTPGSADSSYLYQKINSASPKSGVRMPQDGPYLTTAQINVIRRWIEKGASLQ